MKIRIAFSILLLSMLSGCGGGGDSSGSNSSVSTNSNPLGWLLPVSEVSRKITLANQENVIYGYGCTSQKFYDSAQQLVGERDFYNGRTLPQPLSAGQYTVSVSEIFRDTYNSDGVLYFLSSGYAVETIVFGQSYSISTSSVKLLKFSLSGSRSLVSNTSSMDVLIFDAQLNPVAFTNGTPTVLPAGTYYVLGYHGSVNACRYDESGLFSLIDLGAAS